MTKEEGEWLRYCIRILGKTQNDVCQEIGVKKSYLSMIINGKRESAEIEAKLERYKITAERMIKKRPAQYLDLPPQVLKLVDLLTQKN